MQGQDSKGITRRQREEHVRLVYFIAGPMLKKLDANADKAHWRASSIEYLLRRAHDELIELRKAVNSGNVENIVLEAADLANFAAMIADVAAYGKQLSDRVEPVDVKNDE
jgi:hypothetical protein